MTRLDGFQIPRTHGTYFTREGFATSHPQVQLGQTGVRLKLEIWRTTAGGETRDKVPTLSATYTLAQCPIAPGWFREPELVYPSLNRPDAFGSVPWQIQELAGILADASEELGKDANVIEPLELEIEKEGRLLLFAWGVHNPIEPELLRFNPEVTEESLIGSLKQGIPVRFLLVSLRDSWWYGTGADEDPGRAALLASPGLTLGLGVVVVELSILGQIGIEWSLHGAAPDPDPNAKLRPFHQWPHNLSDTKLTSSVESEPSERFARRSRDKAADDTRQDNATIAAGRKWRGITCPSSPQSILQRSDHHLVSRKGCIESSTYLLQSFRFPLSFESFAIHDPSQSPTNRKSLPQSSSTWCSPLKHLAQRIDIARRMSNAEIKFREIRLKNSGGAGSSRDKKPDPTRENDDENIAKVLQECIGPRLEKKIAQWQLLKYQRDARKLLNDFEKVLAERTGGRVANAYRSAMANVDERAQAEAPPSDVTWADVFITRHPSADPSIKAFIILELNPSRGGPNLLALIDELLLEAPLFPPDCHALKF
ncbi:hypothetical protein M407DRAFT_10664 [Tulasnella calospora MUT 4182]|uniref:Uncharacterized protein n=1 Tax=Tulasnella calospora MUT 4182 TaxID=1051891 RepID=A0A0C3PZH2_9AGAM|nr:hypothetical protein M407DRAFT_10664 [Tulasnella calospora MUT 4182]